MWHSEMGYETKQLGTIKYNGLENAAKGKKLLRASGKHWTNSFSFCHERMPVQLTRSSLAEQ